VVLQKFPIAQAIAYPAVPKQRTTLFGMVAESRGRLQMPVFEAWDAVAAWPYSRSQG
jgi:hypothetical protein